MDQLENRLKKSSNAITFSRPIIFDLAKLKSRNSVKGLITNYKIQHVTDNYLEQLRELYAIKNPRLVYGPNFEKEFRNYVNKLEKGNPFWQQGRWIHYPWLYTLVHLLENRDFQLARTARNKNLINEREQNKFYNAVIGIGGLSIGNSVALAIVLQGGAKHIRLADHDKLALSNLNRIRAGVENLGQRKVEITARQIYELNPYAKVDIFPEGLTQKNISKFFAGPPKLDIVIDELDNLAVKFLIREQAKRHRIAVVMAADNGDNAVVDIERYDLNPKTKFFHNFNRR